MANSDVPVQVLGEVKHVVQNSFILKCIDCIARHMEWRKAQALGSTGEEPVINDAITLAPSWQSTTIQGQVIFACVAVPSCMEHLTPKELSVQEKAARAGLLHGTAGSNGS